MTTHIKTALSCIFLLACAAGCRQERSDSGLDSDPPAAGAVREGTADPQDNPATDPMEPTVQPTPAPGSTTAPSPGTTAPSSPGTTSPPAGAPSGAGAGSTSMNDAGSGRVPPPTSTGP